MAKQIGLIGGWSFDLTTTDEYGVPWDFSIRERREEAWKRITRDQLYMVIGSPPCTAWSQIQDYNWPTMSESQQKAIKDKARIHLKFCAQIYKYQLDNGRYFLHEHPRGAISWLEPLVTSIMNEHRVVCVEADVCAFGLTSTFMNGEPGPAMKPTRFMTNSPHVAHALNAKCVNRGVRVTKTMAASTFQAPRPHEMKRIVRRVTRRLNDRAIIEDRRIGDDEQIKWKGALNQIEDIETTFHFSAASTKKHRRAWLVSKRAGPAQ